MTYYDVCGKSSQNWRDRLYVFLFYTKPITIGYKGYFIPLDDYSV